MTNKNRTFLEKTYSDQDLEEEYSYLVKILL